MEHDHHFEGTLRQRSSSIKVILQNRWSSPIEGHLPSKAVFHQRWSSIKGRLRSSSIKVVFPLRSSTLKGRLPSVVFFHQRSSSISFQQGSSSVKVVFKKRIRHQRLRRPQKYRRPRKDGPKPLLWRNLPSKVVIHKGHLPTEVIFHQRSSSIKGCLPAKVVFHQRSSTIQGHLPKKSSSL